MGRGGRKLGQPPLGPSSQHQGVVLNQFFGPAYQAGAPGSEYLADARTAAMITGCEAAALRTCLDQLRSRPWWRRWFPDLKDARALLDADYFPALPNFWLPMAAS